MPSHPQLRLNWRGMFSAATFLAATGSILGTVLGFLGARHWFLDLFSHFRVQYFWALLLLGAWFLFKRKRAWSLPLFALAAINLALILPFYFNKPAPLNHDTAPLRAMLINVNNDHGNPQKVIAAVLRHDPDFVVLQELDDAWFDTLAPALAEKFPHHEVSLRDDNFGIGLWSRQPFKFAAILHSGNHHGIPSIIAELETPCGNLHLLATHPLPPIGRAYSNERDGQLAEFARRASKTDLPLLLIGDLNATPWCAAFKDLLRVSGLQNASQGRGVFPTWPAFFPAFLRIPIDHVLHTPDIEIISRITGPRVGSDHLPVIVDFKLP